ncbi:TPA: hypothetical protein ACH3X1_015807 [Trebouxia sp. C0004]
MLSHLALVVRHSSSTRTSDPSLATSHSTIYSQSLPANHQKPERPTLLKDILNAAAQMAMVNFDNHVATNFFSRTRRWIRLQLGQKMHFANMEGRREKSWFSLPCRAATRQDGSIWDLLPVYTSLSEPPQDVATDLETLVATMQSLMGPLPVTDQSLLREPQSYLAWLHIVLADFQDAQDTPHAPKLFSMTPQAVEGCQFCQHAFPVNRRHHRIHS